MALKDLLNKITGKEDQYKSAFKDEYARRKIQRILDAREKNANERELERYMEEERQEKIKKALECYRKKQKRDFWKSNTMNGGWDILKDDKPILKQKNIFKMSKTTILHRGEF